MLKKPPVCHPANFIGEYWKVQGFGTFSPNHGYTVDSSLVFRFFLGYQRMPPPDFPLLHLHAPEVHNVFINNTFLGSQLGSMGMHFA